MITLKNTYIFIALPIVILLMVLIFLNRKKQEKYLKYLTILLLFLFIITLITSCIIINDIKMYKPLEGIKSKMFFYCILPIVPLIMLIYSFNKLQKSKGVKKNGTRKKEISSH